MYWVSSRIFWVPMYIFLIVILFRLYKKEAVLMILFAVLLIVLSDQISSSIIKNVFQRARPCHNIYIKNLVHLVSGCGGAYGFVSSHAANTFAFATYLSFVAYNKIKGLAYFMFAWALLVSYSRIYVGAHYPLDVFCGALLGVGLAYIMAKVYFYLRNKIAIIKNE